jgi:hypothetical protein
MDRERDVKGLFKGLSKLARRAGLATAKSLVRSVAKPARPVSAKASKSAASATFATSEDHCRAAMDLLLSRLPPGFIDRAAFEATWIARRLDGTYGTRPAQRQLLALLPAEDAWPHLSPVCDLRPSSAPVAFLLTLDHWASRLERDGRIRESAALLPYLIFQTAGDPWTCPDHEAADGRVARVLPDKPVPSIVDWRWACRCTVLQVSRRQLLARGLTPPD